MPHVPAPPGRDARPRYKRARGRFKVKEARPQRSLQEGSSETTCSDLDGCQPASEAAVLSDSECKIFLAEGAEMPALVQHTFVSCRPAPGGVVLVLRRQPDVQSKLEELEEVPEVDDDHLDEELWALMPAAPGPPRRKRPAAASRARGDGHEAWHSPRLPLRPHSAKRPEEIRKAPTRPWSAKASLGRPSSARATQPSRPSSATRPQSARPSSARPSRPSARPSSARPARPSSARPSSARPSPARPSPARPSSARSSAARPSSARPLSAQRPRPASAPPERARQEEVLAPSTGQARWRPRSAPACAKECTTRTMGSVLFQQQDFLEKQAKQATSSKEAFPRCFTTLMHDWVASYQKSRLRARMACRPLFGPGSDATFTFPKAYPPIPPPLFLPPKKRDLEEELRELERALGGSENPEEHARSVKSAVSSVPWEAVGSSHLTEGAGLIGLDLTNTIGKKVSTKTTISEKVQPVRTIPYDTPRGAMTPGASTVFPQMSMPEPSAPSVGGTENTSASGIDGSEGSQLVSVFGMMPKKFGMMPRKEVLKKVFMRLSDEAEVHKDLLEQSLELLGMRHINQDWVEQILSSVTRYTTLSYSEYSQFVHAYMELQSKQYEDAFFLLDRDGSGTIEASELTELLASVGVTPMDQVVTELISEFDVDNSGELGLDEFCRLLAVINEREGFSKAEYDRFRHAFDLFGDDFGSLGTSSLVGILGYLGYEMSAEVVDPLLASVDVDNSGAVNFTEFLFFMRKIREQEVERLEDELRRLLRLAASDKEELLTNLLQVLGYVPDHEAVRDAAADSNINLQGGAAPSGRRHSELGLLLPDRVKTTKSQKLLTLSEAYRFLEVFRHREGFTRAEAAELQVHFDNVAEDTVQGKRISSLAANNVVNWLGYKATHQEHELRFAEVDVTGAGNISLAEFLKLVRKYRQKDLDEIRSLYIRMGLPGMRNIGIREPASSMSLVRSRSERAPAQKIKDAEDKRYNMVRTAVAKRNQMRAEAQKNQGFDHEEVAALKHRFKAYDSDGSGTIASSSLRSLCQDLLPEMSTDPRFRPDLINMLKQVESEGRMRFEDFLCLARDIQDNMRKATYMKEQMTLEQLSFTSAQVKGFREIFVEHDEDSNDTISFPAVVTLLGSLVPLGDRRVQQLAVIWQKQTETVAPTPNTEEWTMDFPEFLKLINAVLELDFSDIKSRSAEVVNGLEGKGQGRKRRLSLTQMTDKLSLSASSSEVIGPVASDAD